MTIFELGALGEFIGAILLFVSLVYVGLQIKQNTNTNKAITAQHMADNSIQISLFLATNPEIVEVDGSGLNQRARTAFFRAIFHQWQSNYYQQSRGILDDELLEGTINEMKLRLVRNAMRNINPGSSNRNFTTASRRRYSGTRRHRRLLVSISLPV